MRIAKASADNFQSYQRLDFDYSNLGLTLLSGDYKSGKSTVMDLPAWVLFGTTSKDSAADDVKSWFAEGATIGRVMVELPGETLYVTRIRGKRPSENDLYYSNVEQGDAIRGKDATDTQRIISEKLGVDVELYFSGSYLHQFSKADQFFVAKAKDRRETLERIADLSLPIKLGEAASEARKSAKKARDNQAELKAKLEGKLENAKAGVDNLEASITQWYEQHERKVAQLALKVEGYEQEKQDRVVKIAEQLGELEGMLVEPSEFEAQTAQARQQIKALEQVEAELKARRYDLTVCKTKLNALKSEYQKLNDLDGTCPTCLGPADNEHRHGRLAELEADLAGLLEEQDMLDPKVKQLEAAVLTKPKLQDAFQKITRRQLENKALLDKAETLRATAIAMRAEVNPYIDQIEKLKLEANPLEEHRESQQKAVEELEAALAKAIKVLDDHDKKVSALTWLYDKSYELRGKLLEQAVRQLEDKTNEYLDRYFDAVLRVRFSLESDKLDVTITNDGYDCPYKQLSGGERCLLKLAFSINYMRVAEDRAGVKFNVLMLDEALNGLPGHMKVKAFSLLQHLENSYESILLIDHHDEFKNMFSNKFHVVKSGAYSQVSHEQD